MNQEEFFVAVLKALENCRIPYMIGGSVGAMVYGEPRLTNDIDIIADLQATHVDALLSAFASEAYYVPSAEFVQAIIRRHGMFNIIHVESGSKADIIILKDDHFGRTEFARRARVPFTMGCEAYAASPEDVIVAKLRYYLTGRSEKHLRDIAGMIQISGERLDHSYIEQWVHSLGLGDGWSAATRLAEADE